MANSIATRPADWPSWADTGDKTRPTPDAYLAEGWPQSLTPPPRQYFNWAFNELFNGARYHLQRGVPGYAATESYAVGAVVEFGGLHYKCIAPAINFVPTNGAYWERWAMTLAEQTTAINAAVAGITSVYATDAEVMAAILAQQTVQDGRTTNAITTSLSGYVTTAALNTAVQSAVAAANPSLLPPSSLGIFGTGKYMLIPVSQSVTIPTGITSVRIRVIGGGGGGQSGGLVSGSGAGYAHGVFTVVPGAVHVCTVGAGGAINTAGGSTSFGALISATGGGAGGAAGGAGTGGDFQASGGVGAAAAGGAAAGSQRGKGGDATGSSKAGAAVGGMSAPGSGYDGGVSPFGIGTPTGDGGPDMYGNTAKFVSGAVGEHGRVNVGNLPIRFPFDGFTGGGGAAGSGANGGGNGGPGAGGGASGNALTAGQGGDGGGGGASSATIAGKGGIGGGGGTGTTGGVGGRGFIVMEY